MPATSTGSSTVPAEFALLVAAFAVITDSRFARGKVHPLPGVLALVVLGMMAGCRSLSAISRFGQIHPEVLAPLGLRRSPSVATLHRLLRRVSVGEVRTALAAFTRQLLAARTGRPEVGIVAVDGKTLRGSGRARSNCTSCMSLPRPAPWVSIRSRWAAPWTRRSLPRTGWSTSPRPSRG